MSVLAFDTCLGAVSVAIARGAEVVAETYDEIATGHAERLMPMIEAAMADAGVGFADLSRIAVTLGPGTFTGVRTGIAAARAFRLAAGIEVVGTTSLAVIAHRVFASDGAACDDRPLLVALDARRDRLYVQLFGASALDPLGAPVELDAATAATLAAGGPLRLAGSGAMAVVGAASSGVDLEIVAGRVEPHAADLAALASRLPPLAAIAPIYIRPPDAKPQDDKRLPRSP